MVEPPASAYLVYREDYNGQYFLERIFLDAWQAEEYVAKEKKLNNLKERLYVEEFGIS
jgi:hypothetical protein